MMKLSQLQDCLNIKRFAGLVIWVSLHIQVSSFTDIINAFTDFHQLLLSLPALAMCPSQSWYMFHICRVPLLKHWNLVPFRMLQGTQGIAWLCRYKRKFKEAQCLHRGANGIEIDALRAIKWHQTLTCRHLHATLISTDSNSCISTSYTCRYLFIDT